MKVNIGSWDRVVRIVAGVALIVLAWVGVIGVWGWIGIVPLVTGLFKFCPLYSIIGMNTCPMKK